MGDHLHRPVVLGPLQKDMVGGGTQSGRGAYKPCLCSCPSEGARDNSDSEMSASIATLVEHSLVPTLWLT
jgi:hypothetical protein